MNSLSCSGWAGALAVFVLSCAAGSASAGIVSLTMENGDDGGAPFNTTLFTVSNLSGPGVDLVAMSFTVGDTQYLFDQLYERVELFTGGVGSESATLTAGDRTNDESGTDFFSYSFTNFAPGVTFRGQWDIDNDNGDFNADTRAVFFNNGAAPNALATFTFSDGSSIAYTFPDLPVLDRYELAIPGPGTGVVATLGAVWLRRRRR